MFTKNYLPSLSTRDRDKDQTYYLLVYKESNLFKDFLNILLF